MRILDKMSEAVIRGDEEECVKLANEAVKEDIEPVKAIQEGFARGMETVGANFECGKFFLPEMMMAARAMDAGVKVLEPILARKGSQGSYRKGKALLATIQGDQHDIGKNIVKLMMSTAGFEVIDLGKDVRVSKIIKEAQDQKPDIIGVSALMTTTMGYMPELIRELSEMGIRKNFKVMIGGAPVTEDWAQKIGSDGYAKDAAGAVRVAREILGR
jgi:corrinoid protein of di/trimethylamine methyltransferase